MDDLNWTRRYVGIPFVPKGRELDGCDCYGLFRLVQMERFGKALPLLPGDSVFDNAEASVKENAPLIASKVITAPVIGCAVILKYVGMPLHIAVYVGNDIILHTAPKIGAMLSRLTDVTIRSRVVEYRRVD